jgi:16S rRNA (cytosine1402-N4)-methyltransferase
MNQSSDTSIHYSVLKDEVIEQLARCRQGTDAHDCRFLDCTLGGAGHTEALLEALPDCTVIACDRDLRAIDRATKKLAAKFPHNRWQLIHTPFSEVEQHLSTEQRSFDGMLVDLGLSTDQLKESRGFSFRDEDSLDMRMDESASLTAATVVNEYSEKDLIRVLKRGGADKEAYAAVKAIAEHRPFTSTAALSTVVSNALQWLERKKQQKRGDHYVKTNPATVVLQAIRIEVNKEFEEIDAMLDAAPRLVKNGGRLGVITFHSLEDKLVTKRMRAWAQGNTAPAYLGIIDRGSKGKFITSQPIVPSESEIASNPASRSARLRVFEFIS